VSTTSETEELVEEFLEPDDRLGLKYDVPRPLDSFDWRIVADERYRKCTFCTKESEARPASELVVIMIRHERHPKGHMLIFCPQHLINHFMGELKQATKVSGVRPNSNLRGGRVCPLCHVEAPLTAVCDSCGGQV
jgi:hypothetical protein